jgi:hypothetical protein
VTAAPLPERIVEKGLALDHVVIAMVVAKYCDHLPLYRQAAMLAQRPVSATGAQAISLKRFGGVQYPLGPGEAFDLPPRGRAGFSPHYA